MIKLARHAGTVGASAALVGGALLATAGTAAAAPQSAAHLPARTTASQTGSPSCSAHRGGHRLDPWIEGQLARFDPAAKRRLAVFDPWVKDQLAQYVPAFCGQG
ncbi:MULTISPECIES: hypothetical protein [unclassified Streptomyces]|uniref:hypothetical protein n=1 Tax=unclassified Streptomyces TaxID=2593676 RepID=UPI00136805AF|nr:hypothetical protein [Streptomyces sp. SID6139]MYR18731.1 hypothetical protein [Streptomyces sp. SID6137]